MGWNWLDGVLLGILVVSVAAAVWEGLIREVISLLSVVVGIAVAAMEYSRTGTWIERWIHSPELAKGVAFLGLFFGVLIVGTVLAHVLRATIQRVGLGWFDRFLGGIFGIVRGFAITSVLLLAMVSFAIQPAVVQDSVLSPYILMGARVVGAALPNDLNARFRAGLDKFKKALIEKDKKALGK